jgi:hypothetical protein
MLHDKRFKVPDSLDYPEILILEYLFIYFLSVTFSTGDLRTTHTGNLTDYSTATTHLCLSCVEC